MAYYPRNKPCTKGRDNSPAPCRFQGQVMLRVLLARMVRGQWMRPEVGDFQVEAYAHCIRHNLALSVGRIDQTPTDCARNMTVWSARQLGADVVCMVDHDMAPAPGFFAHALDFLQTHRGPTVIASPYCGQPPAALVQVVDEGPGGVARRVGRGDAARRRGDECVLAVGTGLIFANIEAFDLLNQTGLPAYFQFAFDGPEHRAALASEDMFFCLQLSRAGGQVWCAWDYWSGHAKTELVGKPDPDEPPEETSCPTSQSEQISWTGAPALPPRPCPTQTIPQTTRPS